MLFRSVVVEEEARERRRQRFGTAARATSGSQSDMWWRRLGRRILPPGNERREGKGKRRKGRRAEGHAIVSFVERVRQNEFGSDRQVDSANRRPGGRGYLYSIFVIFLPLNSLISVFFFVIVVILGTPIKKIYFEMW